jgi:hypothetical protein
MQATVWLDELQDPLTVIRPSCWTWISGTRQNELSLEGTPDERDAATC